MNIAITAGEPAGIGPDLLIQLAQTAKTDDWVLIADPQLMQQRASHLNLPFPLRIWDSAAFAPNTGINILPIELNAPVIPGQLSSHNAHYVLKTLDVAIDGCLAGQFQAMVTCPVQKSIINEAGIPFSGHTEYLQQRCNTEQVVMMLATPTLKVALVTTHLPLRAVADAITHELLSRVITITENSLRTQFGASKPTLVVCGLNPHAGENGHLGNEELNIISPCLEQLRQTGLDIRGPLPADTLFTEKYLQEADAVIAMYHDQGLPVLKHIGFGNAVNITLGLPIIRTSVDHGTALDLAGSGMINTGSLAMALETARQMAAQTRIAP